MKIVFENMKEIQEFVNICNEIDWKCDIDLKCGSKSVDAQSFLGVASFGTHKVLTVDFLGSEEDKDTFKKCIEKYAFKGAKA